MIWYTMTCIGLGWCIGGLCNEWYRRRHPYMQARLISFGPGKPGPRRARLVKVVNDRPIWQADPSPKPRVRNGD